MTRRPWDGESTTPKTDEPEPDIRAARLPARDKAFRASRTAGTRRSTTSSSRLKRSGAQSAAGRPIPRSFISLWEVLRFVNGKRRFL